MPRRGYARMPWNLKAQLIETCSCNMFCPCWFGVKDLMVMDQGWCASTLLFRVGEGTCDGIDLAASTIVVVVDFPGPTLFDGNATGRIYLGR
ncbi:MAG: DUF1326 domain-containing protein, partial [Acidobacteriaceae bacterium]|nr:DUF1326 domain-containing protein [Acidobacteriaceae bacterium]